MRNKVALWNRCLHLHQRCKERLLKCEFTMQLWAYTHVYNIEFIWLQCLLYRFSVIAEVILRRKKQLEKRLSVDPSYQEWSVLCESPLIHLHNPCASNLYNCCYIWRNVSVLLKYTNSVLRIHCAAYSALDSK